MDMMVGEIKILKIIYYKGRNGEISFDRLARILNTDSMRLKNGLGSMFSNGEIAYRKDDELYVSITHKGLQRLIDSRDIWIQFWIPVVVSLVALVFSGVALYLQLTRGS